MASLLARIRKDGGVYYCAPLIASNADKFVERLSHIDPILVNIQGVVEQLEGKMLRLRDLADDITPCHPDMWFEFLNLERQRVAIYVTRHTPESLGEGIWAALDPPDETRFVIHQTSLIEFQNTAKLLGIDYILIDKMGKLLRSVPICPEGAFDFTDAMLGYTCETLSCMNTRGTRIEPPLDKPPAQVVKPKRAPCSVWHTIHLPKFASEPMNAETSGEVIERREHWVRAHRADYRVGGGLFGRIHALVWVPEHKRGNPELGTVKQIFEVCPS